MNLAPDKNRSCVPRPAAIGWVNDELNFLEIAAGAPEIVAGQFLLRLVAHQNADYFFGRNFPHHLAINPPDRVKFPRPVGVIVWPAEPGGLVRFPFRRHGEAEFGGRLRCCIHGFRHKRFGKNSDTRVIVHRAVRAFRRSVADQHRQSGGQEETGFPSVTGASSSRVLRSCRGNQMRKVVPRPRWLSSSMRPSCARTMRCTIIRPNPVPFFLVV